MKHATALLLAAASLGAWLLSACGGPQSSMPTSNPSSTLATDSAASKVRVSGAAGTLPADTAVRR